MVKKQEYMYERQTVGPFTFYKSNTVNAELIRFGLTALIALGGIWALTVADQLVVLITTFAAAFLATEVMYYKFADHPPKWLMQTLRQKQR